MISVSYLRQLYQERRLDVAVLGLAALFPLHKSFTNVIMLFVFGLVSIIYFRQSHAKITPRAVRYWLITCGFFLMMMVSLTYSADVKSGLNFIVANSYLLLYPLFVLLFGRDLDRRHINFVLLMFTAGCVILTCYLHWVFFQSGLYGSFQQTDYYTKLPFRDVSVAIDFHPTYVTMWLLFACIFLITYIFQNRRQLNVWANFMGVLVIFFLLGTSVLLSVKITTIALAIACLLLIYKVLRRKIMALVGLLLFIAAFAITVTSVSFLRTRFIDEFNDTKLLPPVGLATNSLNIRVGIYICSWHVFVANWLIGTGVGDAQSSLNDCYGKFSTDAYKERTYNTHNNYLGIAVSTGVIGLGLFMFMLGFHLTRSNAHDNLLFMLFLVFVMTILMGENILSRNHGVVFFSLFCSLFARQNLQREKLLASHQ